jgi:hypothetical protein
MQPPGACQFRPVEDPPRVTGGVDAGKKVPPRLPLCISIPAHASQERCPYVRLGVQTCQTPPTPSPVVWPGPVSPE